MFVQPKSFWTLFEASLPLSNLVTRADNSPSRCHRPLMFSMALQLHAKNVLELGVLHGESSLALLLGAFVTGGIVHGVDANPRGFSSRFRPPNLLSHHWHLHVSDALEYLRDVPANVTFDLVFLDDLHDYEHVAKEIQLLAPHLHSNSIVLVHDTMMGFDREAVGATNVFEWDLDLAPFVESKERPFAYMDSQDQWDRWSQAFNRADFGNGGPLRAVLNLPSSMWEWATVPKCFGMTLLRMKGGPKPPWQPGRARKQGPDGYFRY